MRTLPILMLASALLLPPLAVHAQGEASPSLSKPRVARVAYANSHAAAQVDERERARMVLTVLWLAGQTPHAVR